MTETEPDTEPDTASESGLGQRRLPMLPFAVLFGGFILLMAETPLINRFAAVQTYQTLIKLVLVAYGVVTVLSFPVAWVAAQRIDLGTEREQTVVQQNQNAVLATLFLICCMWFLLFIGWGQFM